MSVDIYIVAQRALNGKDRKLIDAYNTMCGVPVKTFPADFIELLRSRLGTAFPGRVGEVIELWENSVEVPMKCEGDIKYGDGAIVTIDQLPEGTDAIRIYIE